MKPLILSKRGNTLLIISMVLSAVLAGTTVLAGTLIANNIKNKQAISYQEAIDIASEIPEVATFIEENEITSVYANLYDGIWTVEFYAGNVNYTEDCYCWMNYAYVEINAKNGKVLYFEVYSPNTPNYSEEEIIKIANAIPEIAAWLEEHENASIYAWYDGYNSWTVDYYDYLYSAYVIISDTDGSVSHFDLYDPYVGAEHTPEEIIAIVEDLPEVQDWISEFPDHEMTIFFSGTVYDNYTTQETRDYCCNITENVWYVDYYTTGNTSEYNWLSVVINDSTEEIISITQKLEQVLSEAEAIAIALAVPDILDFVDSLSEGYTAYGYYNEYNGYWSVYIYSNLFYQNYAYVEILDSTSEVTYYEVFEVPTATMTTQEVMDLINALPEVISFKETYTVCNETIGFNQGEWYYMILGGSGDPFLVTNGLEIRVDDLTGEVLEILELQICY